MKDKSVSEERKLDMNKNGDKMLHFVEQQKKKEKKLVPLRIDAKTVVLVSAKRATKEYAEKKRIEFITGNQLSRRSFK